MWFPDIPLRKPLVIKRYMAQYFLKHFVPNISIRSRKCKVVCQRDHTWLDCTMAVDLWEIDLVKVRALELGSWLILFFWEAPTPSDPLSVCLRSTNQSRRLLPLPKCSTSSLTQRTVYGHVGENPYRREGWKRHPITWPRTDSGCRSGAETVENVLSWELIYISTPQCSASELPELWALWLDFSFDRALSCQWTILNSRRTGYIRGRTVGGPNFIEHSFWKGHS